MTYHTHAYTTRATCRVCGSSALEFLFSLGEQCVSNFVEVGRECSGPRCPIDLELCRRCTLVQARHTAPQDFLYTRHYWYTSGRNDTMKAALADAATAVERVAGLAPGDVVLDVGSNDGTLLRSYRTPGIVRAGIEPATNLQAVGSEGVDHLINDFWGTSACLASFLTRAGKKAKAITAFGMFYDLEDPNAFVRDAARALAPDGVFVAQLMCLKQTLERGDVGNFAHEHLEFYSLRSLEILFGRHGLEIFDVEENDTNGGSYRLWVRHAGGRAGGDGGLSRVRQAFASEERMGLDYPETYQDSLRRLETNRDHCLAFLHQESGSGKRVWVYGASTKGNVIAQWYGLTSAMIGAAADRSPEKWGRVMVGSGIHITSEEAFRQEQPDYAVVLPYAFLPEFVERERAWLEAGGRFVVPLPEFRVVGKEALR